MLNFLFLTLAALSNPTDALLEAAAQGDTNKVDVLLQSGVSSNARDQHRLFTALHNAAAQGHVEICNTLIATGAAVDAIDRHGATPLVSGAYSGRLDIVDLLILHHALLDVVPSAAPTALIAAIMSGDKAVVTRLLGAGANPSLPDFSGQSPIDAAKSAGLQEIVSLLGVAQSQQSEHQ